MDTQETVSRIIATIKSVPETASPGRRAWTNAVKGAFIGLGLKLGYTVCASGFPDECESEWLYDLLWYRIENGHVQEIPLVLEYEQDRAFTSVTWDFQKLLLAKSVIKVMIFEVFSDNLEQFWEFFQTSISSFKPELTDETYICAARSEIDAEFYFKTIMT